MKKIVFEEIENAVLNSIPKRSSGNLYIEQEVCPICGTSHSYDMKDSRDVHSSKEQQEMILSDLKQLMIQSAKLYMTLRNHETPVEEWWQIKVSEARDRISSAYDYMKFKE